MAAQRPWPLTEAVLAFARKAREARDPALAEAGRQAEERLQQPMRVAVVGLLSAGKSTLLNALLETAVAPTAAGECTRVLCTFSHGLWKTASVIPRSGASPLTLPFTGSRLSSQLPLTAADVECVEVTLPSELLEQATLIDTPGLDSTNAEASAVTRELLESDTLRAARAADAFILCINTPLQEAEAEVVGLLRSGTGLPLSGATTIAVLTKFDLWRRPDGQPQDWRATWRDASALARTLAVRHADLFADVLPVIGLLAETARTGVLREHHARLLEKIALSWNSGVTHVVLEDERLFCSQPGPGEIGERQELVRLFGLPGIGILLDALRAGVPGTAAEMTRIALQASGFDEMNSRLRFQLGSRADVLKAGAQLNILLGEAEKANDADIYSAAQELLDRPEMFGLKVLGLARLLASGQVKPPQALADQAWTLATTGLPRVSGNQAAAMARDWREWAVLTDGEGQSVARIMVQAWQLAAQGR
jgi:hypothetical protein